eukprot:NODE_387_length_8274_cov_0.737125.p7 type:complete len:101 gc:universal NODE_387_length_8274_cov_0.737125:6430-6128(-)
MFFHFVNSNTSSTRMNVRAIQYGSLKLQHIMCSNPFGKSQFLCKNRRDSNFSSFHERVRANNRSSGKIDTFPHAVGPQQTLFFFKNLLQTRKKLLVYTTC